MRSAQSLKSSSAAAVAGGPKPFGRDQQEWVFEVREVKSEKKMLLLFFEKCKVKKRAFTLFREVQSEKKMLSLFCREAKSEIKMLRNRDREVKILKIFLTILEKRDFSTKLFFES